MEEFSPLQQFLRGNAVAYYSPWIREGMRRSGIAEDLVTLGGENISEAVAAYLTMLTATFATETEATRQKHQQNIARFVHHNGRIMSTAVANIYRADYSVFLSGFYLVNPSSSDFCSLASESYGLAGKSLDEATLFPGTFFGVTMKENVGGLVDSLALIAREVHKPSITSATLLELTDSPMANDYRWS